MAGTKENVVGFSRKDFLRYQKEHYTASNTIITVSGAFDAQDILNVVKKSFKDISNGKTKSKKKIIDKQIASQAKVFNKTTDQAHIAIAFRSIPLQHPDAAAVSLLSTILGGGMSSRLFLELREELGAAYYVRAEQDSFTDHGMFSITAGIDKTRLAEIVEHVVEVLNTIKTTLVPAEELEKVKEFSLGMMRLGLESSDSIAGFYGTQLLLKGSYKTPEQLTKEYMKVTAQDIQRVANKIFVAEHANIAVVGPFEKQKIDTALLKNL